MTYVQAVSPNINTIGNIGWCLSFVEDVFNTPHSYATATDAWNATRAPHLDRNLPDVSVPVWYSYFEGGFNFGHVAVWVPSRGVLSSPYKQNGTSQWFSSIDECGRVLNSTYLGWSEDLAGVQIVKEGEIMDEQDVRNRFGHDLHNATPRPSDVQAWIGKSLKEWDAMLANNQDWLRQNAWTLDYPRLTAENEALKKDLIPLKPGNYKVN